MTTNSATLQEYDVVKVIQLNQAERSIDGSAGIMRQPRIGDTGTILVVLDTNPDLEPMYVVECVASGGYTIWLAEFAANEIERDFTE